MKIPCVGKQPSLQGGHFKVKINRSLGSVPRMWTLVRPAGEERSLLLVLPQRHPAGDGPTAPVCSLSPRSLSGFPGVQSKPAPPCHTPKTSLPRRKQQHAAPQLLAHRVTCRLHHLAPTATFTLTSTAPGLPASSLGDSQPPAAPEAHPPHRQPHAAHTAPWSGTPAPRLQPSRLLLI